VTSNCWPKPCRRSSVAAVPTEPRSRS
jgi:hypothetical protein